MSCYHPLIRYETNEKYRCLDGHMANRAYVVGLEKGQEYENADSLQEYLETWKNNYSGGKTLKKVQLIPCGKCIGCRLDYSKEWATKAVCEAESWTENWFVTLTYDNEHLPEAGDIIDPETGEVIGKNPCGTLVPEHMTLFIKKLRECYRRTGRSEKIRFISCGEYGTEGARPHYHAIIYNCPINWTELKFHKYNKNYEPLWEALELEKIWGKGLVVVANVNWNTCAYVARYITKKVGLPTDKDYYTRLGIEPEFFRMSRKPGIGREYYETHKDEIYAKDGIIVTKYDGGQMKVKPPKYYDRLYDIETNDRKIAELQRKRTLHGRKLSKNKMSQTTLTKKKQWKLEESTKKSKASALKRPL